ncbi:Sec-independent protein translocase subunit TatA/TatB [Pedobacter africanus]|jgi:sec-independent protein translocase protein TatA|uniref:Sec-independent protein translocase protein TatA n=2 Tax=Pedobacter africanus TaxID=151894 RepID=A0ACC6L3G1_9SPHI|nr:twin-arginine translocase TatA/TatE family subunit [Pedobacter africanus]MDR6786193.1 sec-independent protein translocase protein TatA [Pedobacter africanus]SMC76655.1 sec-independent protein translocase protein TatA [Pedobacter africanus]
MFDTTILAMLGGPEIAIILVIVLLLFGGRKIPELMRGLGKGIKEFKDGKDGADDPVEQNRSNTNKPV